MADTNIRRTFTDAINFVITSRGKKTNDELVVDMAQDMLSKIPAQLELEEEMVTSRPNQHPRPSLADIASIASGAYFKTKGKTSSSAKWKSKGVQNVSYLS